MFAKRCLMVVLSVSSVAVAQMSKPGTGTVTGHVFCQDTQKPARFAQVMLFGIPTALTHIPKLDGYDSKSVQAFNKAAREATNSTILVLQQTALDGSFVLQDVPPGDYYVMASVVGYVQPQELLQTAYDAGEDVTKGVTGVPTLHVSADRLATAEVNVSRGAAIDGNVLWDDGGPVSGAMVTVEPKAGEHKPLPAQFNMMQMSGNSRGNTDDRGHYRIAGLAPGEYTVKVTLVTNFRVNMQKGQYDVNPGKMPLIAYAPGGFRRMEAKPVTLGAGEERTDEDITFNLSATHTVSGRVTSAEDHHGLNRGVVTLTDISEKTFVRTAGLDEDGNFSVTFVPPGTYTMTVADAADTVPEEPMKQESGVTRNGVRAVRTYEKVEQKLMVTDGDLSGQNLELQPTKPADTAGGGD